MANIENYLFHVDADVTEAVNKLREINRMIQIIERTKNKALDDYETTTQKDMHRSMRAMREITKEKVQLEREIAALERELQDRYARVSTSSSSSAKQDFSKVLAEQAAIDQTRSLLEKQMDEVNDGYRNILNTMKELSKMQQNYSRNFEHIFRSKDVRNLPDDQERSVKIVQTMANEVDGVTNRIEDITAKIKEVNKLERRSESLSRRAAASDYMSYQQSKSFFRDFETVGRVYTAERDENIAELARLGRERRKLHARVKEIEQMPAPTDQEIDEKIALQGNIKAIDDEWDARMELNRVLERTIKNMQEYNRMVEGVEVKPERGTFQGMLYERAPAIGLALTGGVAAAMGTLYSRGTSIEESIRPDVISIGQRTDTDTGSYGLFGGKGWREEIRDTAFDMGLQDRLGFSGQEMLAFQETYLSRAGFSDMDDLRTAAQQQAIFSRVSGLNADDTRQFFDTIYGTGAVSGSQTRVIQNAFIGAIKNSGMEGREKDQVEALQGILESVKSGRSMTTEEVMNVMGLQSLLAQTGHRSLRGEQGGRLLTDLNEGIRRGFDSPAARLIFGQGTEYVGLAGRWELRKQMEKGITDIENVNRIARFAEAQSGGDIRIANEVFAETIRSLFNTDITADQVEGIMEQYRSGQLTQERLEVIIRQDQETGADTSEKRLDRYTRSIESTLEQSDAVFEKQAVQMTDFADGLKAVNSSMKSVPPAAYAAAIALSAFAATAIASAGGFVVARGVRSGAAGRYGRNLTMGDRMRNILEGVGLGGLLGGTSSRGGGKGPTGGGTGGPGGGSPILGPDGKPVTPSEGGTKKGGWRSFFERRQGGEGSILGSDGKPLPPSGGGRTGGGLGKIGGVLNKAFLPLTILSGIMSFSSAPEGYKGEAVGSVAGSAGGGWLGAKGGAAIGTAFGPVGTAVGGILGGLVGGLAGSSVGRWVGSLFGGKKEPEPPADIYSGNEEYLNEYQKEEERKSLLDRFKQLVEPSTASAEGLDSDLSAIARFADLQSGGDEQVANEILASTLQNQLNKGISTEEAQVLMDQYRSGTGSQDMYGMFPEQENKLNQQLDRETANTKERTEGKKSDNLSYERENLHTYTNLLNKAEQILRQARMQGGIFGAGGGIGAGTALGQTASMLAGSDNAEKVWNFFKSKGFSDAAVAGILGNLHQESGLDPTRRQSGGPGRGIMQWEEGGRWDQLVSWAQSQGRDPWDLGTQLDYMWMEMTGGDSTGVGILNKKFGGLEGLMNATDVEWAVRAFEESFERAGRPRYDKRNSYARSYLDQLGGSSAQWATMASPAVTNATNNVNMQSTITVKVEPNRDIAEQVTNSTDWRKVAEDLKNKVYGGLNYHSREMKRV